MEWSADGIVTDGTVHKCTVDVIVDVLAVITNIYKLSLGKYKKCFLFSNKLYVHGTVRVHSVHVHCTV